jgi:hypothetical protein
LKPSSIARAMSKARVSVRRCGNIAGFPRRSGGAGSG